MLRLDQALGQRLEQQQKLAPRTIQAMKVLQLPLMALSQHIDQSLSENPVLEVAEPGVDEGPTEAAAETNDGERELDIDTDGGQSDDFDRLDGFADNMDNIWESADYGERRGGDGDRDTKLEMMNNTPQRPVSLMEDLHAQFALVAPSDRIRTAGDFIIDRLDDRGFLTVSLDRLPQEAANPQAEPLPPEPKDEPTPPNGAESTNGQNGHHDHAPSIDRNGIDPSEPAADAESLSDDDSHLSLESPAADDDAAFRQPDEPDRMPTAPLVPLDSLTLDEFIEALDLIQQLDPPGVGAQDLRECLLIQLDRLELDDEDDARERDMACEIILRSWDDLQKNHLPAVQKRTGYDMEDIEAALRFVAKHTDASPGLARTSEANPHVVPDVILTYNEETDDYDIELTDTYLPNLQISRHYREQLEDKSLDKATYKFLINKIQDANWLIEAIEQRRQTLRDVVREVINVQRDFIENGPGHLKPLQMDDVAQKVNKHISTVSRAAADKYVQAPRGVFRLRDCFIAGTKGGDGEAISYDAIREKVREVIENEDKKKPLSDDAITKLLNSQGIDIKRRTVAKYRDEMNIPSTRKRKRF